MESVGCPEEELDLNTPVTAPRTIPSSYIYPTFFPRVSNTASEEAKENVSEEGERTEEARNVCVSEKEGNTPIFI